MVSRRLLGAGNLDFWFNFQTAIPLVRPDTPLVHRPAPVPDPIGDDRAPPYSETSVLEPRSRGVLDARHARGMTTGGKWGMTAEQDVTPRSRGTHASEFCS